MCKSDEHRNCSNAKGALDGHDHDGKQPLALGIAIAFEYIIILDVDAR